MREPVLQNIGQNKSLSSRVAEQIENLIKDGTFASGDQIPIETELQKQMNVGRTAVREAIKILVAKNMLEVRRGQGTFVVENPGMVDDPLGFDLEKDQDKATRDLWLVRCAIEPLSARLAAENITEEEIRSLRSDLEEFLDAYNRGVNVQDADIRLHADIAKASHNIAIARIVPMFLSTIRRINRLSIQYSGAEKMEKEARNAHQALVDAICAHDAAAAEASMREQLEAHRTYLEK